MNAFDFIPQNDTRTQADMNVVALYMSNYEEVCIRPLEDGKFEVSRNYITKKERISPQELVQRVLKYQQHGTMQNVMWIG